MIDSGAQRCRWHAFADASALHQEALRLILDAARTAIADRGAFLVVLAGGTTPRAIYGQLKQAATAWSAWHIYFGDERCLPAADPARNSRMAAEAWLDHVPVSANLLHVIPAELGANAAARIYAESLRRVGEFDLVLLGLGEDGHTASLFPGNEWGSDPGASDTIAVLDAPAATPQRVSLSAARLSRARQVLFLVSGASKRGAVDAWRAGQNIPAQAIRPEAGVDVLLESALWLPLRA